MNGIKSIQFTIAITFTLIIFTFFALKYWVDLKNNHHTYFQQLSWLRFHSLKTSIVSEHQSFITLLAVLLVSLVPQKSRQLISWDINDIAGKIVSQKYINN